MKNTFFVIFLFSFLASDNIKKNGMPHQALTKKAGKTAAVTDRKYADHSGNRVLCRFYNFGAIGDAGGPFSGVYPIGSGNSYFYEFSPVVAASVVDSAGNRVHIISDGTIGLRDMSPQGYQWGFEPLPKYANPNQDYMAINTVEESWPESWPNRPSDWNGFWNGQYGKYVRADQETYFVMDDYYNDEFNYFPDANDADSLIRRRGLGIEIEARGYQWNHPAAEDIIIVTYWITNVGTNTLDSVIFGMYGDADIGSTQGDFSDDDAWFDIENDMVFQWDHDGWSNANGGFKPAYFGWSFLESPGNPHDGIDNDGDGMIDESQFDGIDNDEDWLAERDDIGADGLGSYHIEYTGPDPDGTEGNGVPDLGEPNFEITDNDESDQIGLTSFYSATYPSVYPANDEVMWSQLQPNVFQVPEQNTDQTFLYGSGYISLQPGESKKFAIAMVFGEDMADILRNTKTMQNIYDNDYSFAKPPLKPTLTVVPGNKRTTLYWDDFAEKSMDPIYGLDFEGYRIYRSTDPGFIDAYTITDTYGNIAFKKPIKIFDLENGLIGPHPIRYNGVQFDMGEDSKLRYMFVDSVGVTNGQKYYYAITSYDKGYDLDFFELGFSESENLQAIAPSECSVTMDLDFKGNVVSMSENAGVSLPNAPAAGYIPPNTTAKGESFISHTSGYGSGDIDIVVIDPYAVPDKMPYKVVFDTLHTANHIAFNVLNDSLIIETLTLVDSISRTSKNFVDTNSVVITNVSGSVSFDYGQDYLFDFERGNITGISGAFLDLDQFVISYKYYPLYQRQSLSGEADNPVFDGMKIYAHNRELGINYDSTKWIAGESNYIHEVVDARIYPADFELRMEQSLGDLHMNDALGNEVPFYIKNTTHDNDPDFRILDYDQDQIWDPDEPVLILPYEGDIAPYMFIRFYLDSLDITVTTLFDTVITETDTIITETTLYDTTEIPIVHAEKGDVFRLATYRPFSQNDVYSFTSIKSQYDPDTAKAALKKIAVIPNPYVVAASWEPRHIYNSGRGPRKIDFINLPAKCTIKIFTLAGYLVDIIEHNSLYENGSHSWDLLSKDGLEISYGIYLYHIDAEGVGETTGKFAIIK